MIKKSKGESTLVSKNELEKRLKGKLTPMEIENLMDEHNSASSNTLPDIEKINKLAKKKTESKLLKISFSLTEKEYDALAKYFNEEEMPGTELVRKTLDEFIELTT